MLLIFLGRVAQFALTLLLMRIATTLLSPSEFGRLALMTSLWAFLTLLLVSPVGMYVNRKIHSWEKEGSLRGNFFNFWRYLVVVGGVTAVVVSIFHTIFGGALGISPFWLIALMVGIVVFLTANQTIINALNMLGEPKWFIGLTLSTLLLSIVLGMYFVHAIGARAESWALGLLVSYALVAAVAQLQLNKKMPPKTCVVNPPLLSEGIKRVFSFSWPVSFAVGLVWVQAQSYRFFVEDIFGFEQLGYFVAGYGVAAGILSGYEAVVTAYFQPKFYRDISSRDTGQQVRAWNQYAEAVFPSLLLTGAFIAFFSSEITHVFLGPKFQMTHKFVIWGVLAESFRVSVNVYSLIAHIKIKTKLLLPSALLGALVSLAFITPLSHKLELRGVGLALVAAGGVALFCNYFLLKRQLAVSLPRKRLVLSALLSFLLLVLIQTEKSLFGPSTSIYGSLVILTVFGGIFMGGQYYLLRPILFRSI